jgi:hypothetical protein
VRFSFAQVAVFVAKWRKLRLTDEDLQALERLIAADPEAGDVMRGAGGVRKVRFAPPSWNTGKSGAARVCYAVFASIGTVYLLTLFAKNEKSNLSDAEKATLRTWMKQMQAALKGRE